MAEEILAEEGVEAANVVFDCTGAEVCVQMSVFVSNFFFFQKCDLKRESHILNYSLSRTVVALFWLVWVLLFNLSLLLMFLLERLM